MPKTVGKINKNCLFHLNGGHENETKRNQSILSFDEKELRYSYNLEKKTPILTKIVKKPASVSIMKYTDQIEVKYFFLKVNQQRRDFLPCFYTVKKHVLYVISEYSQEVAY